MMMKMITMMIRLMLMLRYIEWLIMIIIIII